MPRLYLLSLEDRLTPNGGSLDVTFHGNGYNILSDRTPGGFNDVAVDAANRTIAVGQANGDMLVARFRPDGTPDPLFADNGFLTVDFAGKPDSARGVAVRNDGSLWVSGGVTDANDITKLALLDISPAGVVRQKILRDVGADGLSDIGNKLTINPRTGDIYVAGQSTRIVSGSTYKDNAVARFSGTGAYLGEWRSSANSVGTARDVAVDPASGMIFLAGQVPSAFYLVRLNADLTQPTFANVTLNPNIYTGANAVVFDPNNSQVYYVGTSANGHTVVRTDTNMTVTGKRTFLTGTNDVLTGLALGASGDLVAVGFSDNTNSVSGPFNIALARLNPDLTLDTTFGTGGTKLYNLGGNDVANGVSLAPDGRIVVAGSGAGVSPNNKPFVARYLAGDATPPPVSPNSPPTVAPPADQTVAFGTPTIGPLAVAVADGQTPASYLIVTATTDAAGAALLPAGSIFVGGGGTARTVTVTPAPGVTGTATLTIAVTDQDGATTSSTFTVAVLPSVPPPPVNRPPVAVADAATVVSNSAATIDVLANDTDADGNTLTITGTAGAANGTTSFSASAVVYRPNPGFTGTDSFAYMISDGKGGSATANVTVVVTPVPGLRVGANTFAVGSDVGRAATASLFGATGNTLFTATPFDAGFTGGVRTAAADFNGDGVVDLVAGTGPGRATRVTVVDGKTQAVLFELDPFEADFTGGVFVAAGDLTGDGVPELVVTPDQGGGPRVRVFDGKGFFQIADFFGIDDPNFRGGARAAVGDVTGDGVGDLLVAAGFGGGPRLATFDGTSLVDGAYTVKPFPDFFAFEPELRNGIYVAAGDLDGDGIGDIVAGAGPGGGPRVLVLSGRDLAAGVQTPLANFFAGDVENRGGVRVAVKNLDGDARADLVVGSGDGGGSRVTAYAGVAIPRDGTPAEVLGFDAFDGLGGVFVG